MPSYGECTDVFSVIPRVLPVDLLEDYCLGFIQEKQENATKCRSEVNGAYRLLTQKGASCKMQSFYDACNVFAVNDGYNLGILGEVQEKLLNQCRDVLYKQRLLIDNIKNKFAPCQITYQCAEHYRNLDLIGGDKTLVIKRFRALTKENHPDQFPDPEQKNKAKIKQESIQAAYGFIKDHCTELSEMEDFIQSLISFENSQKAQEESRSLIAKGVDWLYGYLFGGIEQDGFSLMSGKSLDYPNHNEG